MLVSGGDDTQQIIVIQQLLFYISDNITLHIIMTTCYYKN